MSDYNYELKPCPFCGDTARLSQTTDNHKYYYVSCDGAVKTDGSKSCYACIHPYGGCYKTPEEAVNAWNRRKQL